MQRGKGHRSADAGRQKLELSEWRLERRLGRLERVGEESREGEGGGPGLGQDDIFSTLLLVLYDHISPHLVA